MISVTSRSYVTEKGAVIFKGKKLPVAKIQQNLHRQKIGEDSYRLSVKECLWSLAVLVISSALMTWIVLVIQ